MVADYCNSSGSHTIRHKSIESVHCTPKTNIILYTNCTKIKKIKNGSVSGILLKIFSAKMIFQG